MSLFVSPRRPLFISLSLSFSQWSTTPIILNYRYILTFFVNFSAGRCIVKRKTFPFDRIVCLFPGKTIERSGIHGYLCALFQPKRINLPYNYQFEDPLYYNCISIKRGIPLYTTRVHTRTRSFPANHEFHPFYEKLLLFPLTDLFPLPRETLRTNDWFNHWFLPKNNDILIDIKTCKNIVSN